MHFFTSSSSSSSCAPTFIIYAKSGKNEMWMFTTDDPRFSILIQFSSVRTNGENRAHGTRLKARGLRATATAAVAVEALTLGSASDQK